VFKSCFVTWVVVWFGPFCFAAGPDELPLVTNRVQSWVDRGYYEGCSVWVAQGDRVLYKKNFGKNSGDTPVYIASAGKWLGAAAILALVDEGLLSLDDSADKWIPEMKGDPKGRSTLRQMLSHTSGYPPYQPAGLPRDGYQTTAESVAHLMPLPPHFAPEAQFEYGGLAMQVAGRMAELAAGLDWETIFQRKIARPLGMKNTRFTPVDSGHTPMIGGGAVSTFDDYVRFLTMIADGGVFEGRRVLSAKAIEEMTADQVRGAVVKREEFVERMRGYTHRGVYGLGMWREEVDGSGAAVVLSSPSWAGTYPWIDRRHNIRGLIMAHVDGVAAGRARFSGFWTSPVLMNIVRAKFEWNTPRHIKDFREGVVPMADGDLAYEIAGAGEAVILLHGHSFDRRMWDLQFAELATRYRVVRYDLRGYGLSALPTEGRDFRHADDLIALMNHLGIEKAHAVGFSLGGSVVGDVLALHPDRLLSATIASCVVDDGPGRFRATGEVLNKRLEQIKQTRAEGIDAFKARQIEDLLKSSGSRAPALRPVVAAMVTDWPAWQSLHVEPPCLLGAEAIRRIAELKPKVPVLWLVGDKDSDRGQYAQFASVLPQIKRVELKNSGHLCSLEQPVAFTEALLRFWSENRADTSLPTTSTPR
jgi:CubicO group peptidase (beta-lactamase class C family)/pimeloyl-ACP methyl ester carboxylesterase